MPESENGEETLIQIPEETVAAFRAGDLDAILEALQQFGLNLLYALLIFFVGRMVAMTLRKIVRKVLDARKVDPTITGFITGLAYAIIMVGVVLAALKQVGIETTSFVAIIGAAGLAVGLALQGSLANFAAGFMIILFKPIRVGCFVEAAGTAGIVEEIGIFTTTMRTGDNREIIVPNNAITSGNIINFSARETRRVDLTIGVSYDDDLKAVKALLLKILSEDPRVLEDPAPTVGVLALGDSSVDFCVRPWVKSSDYWPVLFDLNQTIKEQLEENGFSIPYPQRDVHVHNVVNS